jgi:triphosphoribosyl-dephospho-CoA synthase
MSSEADLQRLFIDACTAELQALKPGNVHVFADGHDMTVDDFLRSAAAAAPPLCRSASPVGIRISAAVEASWEAAACNTNLGIVLLAAPLLAAAERQDGPLRARLDAVLQDLSLSDAEHAFAAIRRANPGGLGRSAEQDVGAAPTVTLLEAMRLAAGRDRIARQYATGYEDVFAIGIPRLTEARRVRRREDWATTLVFLDFLAAFPDSHIDRKFGAAVAGGVRAEAATLRENLPADPEAAFPHLIAFDRDLKRRGLNPGTTADLTVATLLASAIEGGEAEFRRETGQSPER